MYFNESLGCHYKQNVCWSLFVCFFKWIAYQWLEISLCSVGTSVYKTRATMPRWIYLIFNLQKVITWGEKVILQFWDKTVIENVNRIRSRMGTCHIRSPSLGLWLSALILSENLFSYKFSGMHIPLCQELCPIPLCV